MTVPTPHEEHHFKSSELIRDLVIGMADGLTVPFALAAGLSGAVDSTALIITAGLAEVAAGSIAMGLGGYLAARTDAEHYSTERLREQAEINDIPEKERTEVADVFREYGLTEEMLTPVVTAICSNNDRWIDFMMKFELGLERPDPSRARTSAMTIAIAYIVGGVLPLIPYLILKSVQEALIFSALTTLTALFLFGFFKGKFTTNHPLRSAFQTMLVGALAASAAFGIARAIR